MKFGTSVAALLFASAVLAPCGGALAQTVTASVYSEHPFDGQKMANGQIYRHKECTLAHKTLPFGAIVRITARNGKSIVAPVTDRGPFVAGREYDLAGGCASELNVDGLPKVVATVVSLPSAGVYNAYAAYHPKQKKKSRPKKSRL